MTRINTVGDVVNIDSSVAVSFDGSNKTNTRAQIQSIKPVYSQAGRHYSIEALTYAPEFGSGGREGDEVVINDSDSSASIDLFNDYAGAPPLPVNMVFIFDGVDIGGETTSTPTVSVGNFALTSLITIILVNGATIKGRGGNGGNGQNLFWDAEPPASWDPSNPTNGLPGGTALNASGVAVDIYFSGATPSALYPTANGSIFAGSGGAGGKDGAFKIGDRNSGVAGDGGNGGDGLGVSTGGRGGLVTGVRGINGVAGAQGDPNGATGYGRVGLNNNAIGGAAGSGVVDSGGTVTFYGDTISNYKNGNGDH